MDADAEVSLCLAPKLRPLLKTGVYVLRPCVVNADIPLAFVQQLLKLEHNGKVNVFFHNPLFNSSRRAAPMPCVNDDHLVINLLGRQEIHVQIPVRYLAFHLIHRIQGNFYYAVFHI